MENKIKLTDQELLKELSLRFEDNTKMIEQMEELNEKLIDSEMMKSHFLSNIKNEISNPISAILGLSNGISNKSKDEQFVTNSSKLIYAEAFNLNFQLKNIFIAAEIEAGEAFPEISDTDVRQLIENICESYQFLAHKKNVTLTVELQANLNFTIDSQKLSMILVNLLSNAIKFSEKGGEVKVSVLINSENELFLKVQDFGIGVDEQNKKVIFDRFKQLEYGTTKQFLGHGLGLSIVSSLVDILDGKLDSDCELGSGCKFLVIIPKGINNTNEFSANDNSFLFFDDDDTNEEIF